MTSPQEPYIHGDIEIASDIMHLCKDEESSVHRVGKNWYAQMGVPLRDTIYASRMMMHDGANAEERAVGAAILSKIYDAGYNISLITKIEEMEKQHAGRISAYNGTVINEFNVFEHEDKHKKAISADRKWIKDSSDSLEACYMMRDSSGFRGYEHLSERERKWALDDLSNLEGVLGELATNVELDERYELQKFLDVVQNEILQIQEFNSLNSATPSSRLK